MRSESMSEMRKCNSYKSIYNLCAMKSWPNSLLLFRLDIQRAKVVKRNITNALRRNERFRLCFSERKGCKTKYNRCNYVLHSFFSERNSYISINNLAYTSKCNNFRAQRL